MLHMRFSEKAGESTQCGGTALFKRERFCLFVVIAPPKLGLVVQDHIQQ